MSRDDPEEVGQWAVVHTDCFNCGRDPVETCRRDYCLSCCRRWHTAVSCIECVNQQLDQSDRPRRLPDFIVDTEGHVWRRS